MDWFPPNRLFEGGSSEDIGEFLKREMYAGYRQLTSFDFSGNRPLQAENLKMGKWYKIGIRADFVPLFL